MDSIIRSEKELFRLHEQELFPQEIHEGSAAYVLCHTMVHGSGEEVAQRISSCSLPDLAERITVRGVTPLQVAAMVGKLAAVRELMDRGVKLVGDAIGWTALHCAALRRDRDMLQLMTAHFPEDCMDHQTHSGLSARAIEYWVLPPSEGKPDQVYLIQGGEQRQLSAKRFKDLTAATYVDRSFVSQAYVAQQWWDARSGRHDDSLHRKQWFDARVPKLALQMEAVKAAGWGACLLEDVAADGLIGRYVGIVEPRATAHRDSAYRLEGTDALHYRNITAQINHGFPNVMFSGLSIDDMPCSLVEAICDIAAGTRLYADYGPDYRSLRAGPLVELNEEGLIAFFKKHSVASFAQELPGFANHPVRAQYMRYASAFAYLGHTPTAILCLLREKVASPEDMRKLFVKQNFLQLCRFDQRAKEFTARWIKVVCAADDLQGIQRIVATESAERALADLENNQ